MLTLFFEERKARARAWYLCCFDYVESKTARLAHTLCNVQASSSLTRVKKYIQPHRMTTVTHSRHDSRHLRGETGRRSIKIKVWTESHSVEGSIHPRYKSGSLKHRTPCQRTSRSSAPSPCCGHRRRLLHKARMVLAFLSSELSIPDASLLTSSRRRRARLSCELSTRTPYATFLPASSPFLRALNALSLRHLPAGELAFLASSQRALLTPPSCCRA